MRDENGEPDVGNEADYEPVEAMVAMVLAWGFPASVAFGDADADADA